MKNYVCLMHPEIASNKPGRCPKCGMELTIEHHVSQTTGSQEDKGLGLFTVKNYIPLVVILLLIFITTLTLSLKDFLLFNFALEKTISYFMAGFFIIFAGFKLIDLKGFAQGYATYDLIAQRYFAWGYIYPFVELAFGLSMILIPQSLWLLLTEFIVMSVSGLGVALKLAKGEKFQCVCLGTFLKVPLTKVTLIEDFGMASMALISIIL